MEANATHTLFWRTPFCFLNTLKLLAQFIPHKVSLWKLAVAYDPRMLLVLQRIIKCRHIINYVTFHRVPYSYLLLVTLLFCERSLYREALQKVRLRCCRIAVHRRGCHVWHIGTDSQKIIEYGDVVLTYSFDQLLRMKRQIKRKILKPFSNRTAKAYWNLP